MMDNKTQSQETFAQSSAKNKYFTELGIDIFLYIMKIINL